VTHRLFSLLRGIVVVFAVYFVKRIDYCPMIMDDPLSRALRDDEQVQSTGDEHCSRALSVSQCDLSEKTSPLSVSHNHNDWILPALNRDNEEAEIHREKLQITVSNPRKHKSNLDSFVTYLVTTRTYNDAVQIHEHNVRRRYNDFVWLKALLDSKYAYNILPPLPVKHSLSNKLHVVNDDGEFIRRRMAGTIDGHVDALSSVECIV
jgi:hypothetical protein